MVATKATYNENDLLKQFREGDECAYTILYKRHLDAIYYFCRRKLLSDQDAEDITATVFKRLWLLRTTFDVSKPLRPWLYTVAHNLCLNHIKS